MRRVLTDFPSIAEVAMVEKVIRSLQRQSRSPVNDSEVLCLLPIGFPLAKLQKAVALLVLRDSGLRRLHDGFLSYRDLE